MTKLLVLILIILSLVPLAGCSNYRFSSETAEARTSGRQAVELIDNFLDDFTMETAAITHNPLREMVDMSAIDIELIPNDRSEMSLNELIFDAMAAIHLYSHGLPEDLPEDHPFADFEALVLEARNELAAGLGMRRR